MVVVYPLLFPAAERENLKPAAEVAMDHDKIMLLRRKKRRRMSQAKRSSPLEPWRLFADAELPDGTVKVLEGLQRAAFLRRSDNG